MPLETIPVTRANGTEFGPQVSTELQPSAYVPLTNNREPDNFYQPLQFPGAGVGGHHSTGGEQLDQTMQYENPAFDAHFMQ